MIKKILITITMIMMMAFASLVWAGCHHASAGQANDIRIEQAQVDATTSDKTEAIMLIKNLSDQPLTAVAVYSPVAEMSAFHQWVGFNSDHKHMVQIPNLTIPAKGTLTLQANGTHVMLMALKAELPLNQLVPITLIMADGSTITAQAQVVNFK